MGPQVVSRARVADHGEVMTHQREVDAMLDLVEDETSRIDSRFLEPACGNGNFLAEILRRKLTVVERRYAKSQIEFERYSVLAVTSIYGIDLLEDNIEQCRDRMLSIFEGAYRRLYGGRIKEACIDSVRFILGRNIVRGDALTLMTVGDQPEHIVFSEWSPVNGSLLKRRDFTFHELLAHQHAKALPLFSDLGDDVFIPTPEREFPAVHFLELPNVR